MKRVLSAVALLVVCVATPAVAQEIGLGVGTLVPRDKLADGAKSGFSAIASIELGGRIALRAEALWANSSLNGAVITAPDGTPVPSGTNVSGDVKMIGGLASLVMHLGVGPIQPYIFAGASQIVAQGAPVEWQLRREGAISGNGSGRAALSYVMTASRGPDGTLVVSQPDANYLVLYDSTGKFIRTLGRSGRGPGEFSEISKWGWRGDSIWVYDRVLRRLTVLARNGGVVRDTSGLLGAGPDEAFAALLSNGAMLIRQHDFTAIDWRRAPAGTQLPLSFRLEMPNGTRGPEIGPFRMVTTTIAVETEAKNGAKATSFVPWLWQDNPLVGVSPNGAHIVVVEAPYPTTSTGSFRVHTYAPTGQLVSSTASTFVATPITQAIRDSVNQLVGNRLTTKILNTALQRAPKPPQWLRAFDRLVVLNDGTLWLRSPANTQRWFAVSTRGRIMAQIRVPAGGEILDGRGESVWVSVPDDMDVPSIVRYKIDRR